MSYPDELRERDWLDDILGKGRGDFDMKPRIRYIGEDKALLQRSIEPTNRRDWDNPNPDYIKSDEDLENQDV